MPEVPFRSYYVEAIDVTRDLQIVSPTFSVYNAGTSTLASIFADDQGLSALTNPIVDNPVRFFVNASSVDIQVAKGSYIYRVDGVVPTAHRHVFVALPASMTIPSVLPSFTLAGLPPAGTAGRLARVTDDVRGVRHATGERWEQIYPIVNVERFSGANLGVRIQAALDALPAAGGVVDARAFSGAQSLGSSTITIGANKRLLLGAGTYTSTASPAFLLNGNSASLFGIGIDATAIASGAGDGIQVTNAWRTHQRDFTLTTTGLGIVISGTAALGAHFNRLSDLVVSGATTGIRITSPDVGANANITTLINVRSLSHTVVGFDLTTKTARNVLTNCEAARFSVLAGTTGFVISGSGHTLVGGAAEANAIGYQIDSTALDIKFLGAGFSSNTVDFVNNSTASDNVFLMQTTPTTGNLFSRVRLDGDPTGNVHWNNTGFQSIRAYAQGGVWILNNESLGDMLQVDGANPADTQTSLLVRRNVSGTITVQRVTMGAVDSGGAGFKLLRVPN